MKRVITTLFFLGCALLASGQSYYTMFRYTPPPTGGGTQDSIFVQVSQSTDDAEESDRSGMDLTSSDLELIVEGSAIQVVGMRFQSVGIPQGATIDSAFVQFCVDETTNEDPVSLDIQAQDADDPVTFDDVSSTDITDRPYTTASVNWQPPQWTTTDDCLADQRTPDISSVIQEVVDRAGFTSSSAIVIIIDSPNTTSTRVAKSYDGEPAGAPELIVYYTN